MDVDDVAAVCAANALADNGEADLIAVIQNSSPKGGAGVASVLNTFYGRDNVPIGAYKGTDLSPDAPFLPYVTDLIEDWPSPIKNSSQVPSGVEVYRSVLATQADRSVHISSIGLMTNLKESAAPVLPNPSVSLCHHPSSCASPLPAYTSPHTFCPSYTTHFLWCVSQPRTQRPLLPTTEHSLLTGTTGVPP